MKLDTRQATYELIVNLHKDAYGFKPRSDAFKQMINMSNEDLNAYLKDLSEYAKFRAEQEAQSEQTSFNRLDKLLDGMCRDYNINRKTAIRWEMQANDCDDIEHWLYNWGISFNDMHHFTN